MIVTKTKEGNALTVALDGRMDAVSAPKLEEDPKAVSITFIDGGIPYDPLAKADPDITASAEERPIGGLGIYMVKQSVDTVDYRYQDGRNVLAIQKKLS